MPTGKPIDTCAGRGYTDAPVVGLSLQGMFHVEHGSVGERAIISEFLCRLGEPASVSQLDKFREYCSLVRAWSSRRSLLSRHDLPKLASLHVCDSLSALPLVAPLSSGPVLDIGSGAGLPGLPLAIMRPSLQFVLLEARQGRAEFLQVAIERLDLRNAQPIHAGARELGPPHSKAYGVVMARAVGKLRNLLPLAERHVAPDGRFVAFKGPSYRRELETLTRPLPLALLAVHKATLPQKHGSRYLLVFGRN